MLLLNQVEDLVNIGVGRRISSPSEQADLFSIIFQLSPISRARRRIIKDDTSNSSLRGRSESLRCSFQLSRHCLSIVYLVGRSPSGGLAAGVYSEDDIDAVRAFAEEPGIVDLFLINE
jgi:hypothetical protein